MVVYLTARENNIELSEEDYKTRGEELAVEYGYADLEEYESANGRKAIEVNVYTEILIDKMLGEDAVEYEMPETSVETETTEPEADAEDNSSETTDAPDETNDEPAETKTEETTGDAAETSAAPDETVA